MSDRIAVMDKGHVLQVGLPADIYNRPATRFVADFIGETNFIGATVSEVHGDEATVLIDDRLPLRVSTHDSHVASGDKITLAIRPEKIDLRSPHDSVSNYLPGKVEECIFIGTDNRYVVRVAEKTALVVRCQNSMTNRQDQFEVGTEVRAECSAEHALILTS
jgi:spermidine/putrescine transport system ATP-binding protein